MAGRRINGSSSTNNVNSDNLSSSGHNSNIGRLNGKSDASTTTTTTTTTTANTRGGGGGGGGHRGSNNHAVVAAFNPKLILSQMVALQCGHYLFLLLLVQTNHVVFGTSITIDRIFTDHYFSIWSGVGWIDNSAVLVSAVVGAVLLALVVEKAKKCLDFSFTLFMIHTIACTMYDGVPSSWDWWIVHVLHLIIMVVMGEYLCSRKEMRDIPLLSL